MCLANYKLDCSGIIGMTGEWIYMLGFLSIADAADLLTFGRAGASSPNGTVLPLGTLDHCGVRSSDGLLRWNWSHDSLQ